MRNLLIVIIVLVLFAGLGYFLMRDTSVEINFGQDWPDVVQGVGEGIETIVAAPDGSITAGDRARATERARWKAYYNAQLRLGEQLGGLKLNATTTIKDTELVDRELKTAYAKTIRAAAEVPDKSQVEDLGDSIRARVVVETAAPQIKSFRASVLRLLQSGKITIRKELPTPLPAVQTSSATTEKKEAETPTTAPEKEKESERVAVTPDIAASGGLGGFLHSIFHPGATKSIKAPEKTTVESTPVVEVPASEPPVEEAPEPRSSIGSHRAKEGHPKKFVKRAHHAGASKKHPEHSGSAILLAGHGGFVSAAPDFYDGAGTFLGTSLDLPAEQRSAGLVLASPQDKDIIGKYAGSAPLQLSATISKGNVIFEESMDLEEAAFFKKCLHEGKIVLILEMGE